MLFSEKLRALRMEKNLSQRELADAASLSLRTIQYWESGERMPKKRESYAALARVLDVDVNALMDENAAFSLEARDRYGARGARQAAELVRQVSQLYAGGDLAEEDMEAMNLALQEAYWAVKKTNRKFVPRKFR